MLEILDTSQVGSITDPHVRALVELRLEQLGTLNDAELIVVELNDSAEYLEAAIRCPILTDPFSKSRFGDEDFTPTADAIEDHGQVYTMLFVTTDDHAVELFIPKTAGIDSELMAMCREYAVQAVAA